MTKKRTRRNNDASVIAIAINSHWRFSAMLSAGILSTAYLILPAFSAQNAMVLALSGAFKPILIMFGGAFALIAVFNFLRQHKSAPIPIERAVPVLVRPSQPVVEHQVVHGWSKEESTWGNLGFQSQATDVKINTPWGRCTPTVWSIGLLQQMEWKLFEDLSTAYYKEKGIRAELTKLGADGGIDIKLFQGDSEQPTSIVQCKAWNSKSVGVKSIREFLGVMSHEKIAKGFFMTSGAYTDEAKDIAKTNRITLIDGGMFLAMIQRLPEDAQLRLLNLVIAGDYTTPSCSRCGVKMIRRTGKQGDFWGCKNYPKCRQTLHIKKA
jgi:restriction system protein